MNINLSDIIKMILSIFALVVIVITISVSNTLDNVKLPLFMIVGGIVLILIKVKNGK